VICVARPRFQKPRGSLQCRALSSLRAPFSFAVLGRHHFCRIISSAHHRAARTPPRFPGFSGTVDSLPTAPCLPVASTQSSQQFVALFECAPVKHELNRAPPTRPGEFRSEQVAARAPARIVDSLIGRIRESAKKKSAAGFTNSRVAPPHIVFGNRPQPSFCPSSPHCP